MPTAHQEPVPSWLWNAFRLGSLLVITTIAFGAYLIHRGAADPPVAGPVIWRDTELSWLHPPSVTSSVSWSAAPATAAFPTDRAFTLSASATAPAASDPGATWGIWAASSAGTRIVWAIRSDRYLTIRRCPTSDHVPSDPALLDCPPLIPDWGWHFYPRIHSPGMRNTLTLHRESGGVRLRINHELLGLASPDLTGTLTGRWGLLFASDPTGPLRWHSIELRAASPASP